WLKNRPPWLPCLGLVNGTQREPLSEKLPFQRTPEVVVQTSPSQVVWPSSTTTHFILAGRPSILHDQVPPPQPVAILARDGPKTARHRASPPAIASAGRFMLLIVKIFLMTESTSCRLMGRMPVPCTGQHP